MRLTKEQKGITLIALVITIIVLLILAGVALATLTGNTSIIDNANYAVVEYNKSAGNDQNVLNQVENLFAKYLGENSTAGDDDDSPAVGDDDDDTPPTPTEVTLTAGQSASVDENGYATIKTKIVADAANNIQIVIPTGFAPAILNGSNSTTSNPGQDGSVKEKMPAANWSSITAAQINSGVVIVNAAGEEFVWVPIPNSSNFARTAWTWTYDFNKKTQTLADTQTADAYWEDTSTTEYTNMVSSVNTNKGFYISRYEASEGSGNAAQSKRGISPWVSIAQNDSTQTTDAIRASAANSITNTHLMYGIEWDSVLNWLIGHAIIGSSTSGQTKTMELADITNSRSWGNHYDSTGDAATNSRSSQSTGYSEYWKSNNIYDLAGNVSEWTQEKYSTGADRAIRGNDYFNSGAIYPAAYRGYLSETWAEVFKRFPFQLLLVALDSGSDAV